MDIAKLMCQLKATTLPINIPPTNTINTGNVMLYTFMFDFISSVVLFIDLQTFPIKADSQCQVLLLKVEI